MILMLLSAGCASVETSAICDGTRDARDAHTVALLNDGGPESMRTGASLISKLDAACQDV